MKNHCIKLDTEFAKAVRAGKKKRHTTPKPPKDIKPGDIVLILANSDNPGKKAHSKLFATVKIKSIQIIKLGQIGPDDAVNEGVQNIPPDHPDGHKFYKLYTPQDGGWEETTNPVRSYKTFWDKTFGKKFPWSDDREVTLITFTKTTTK